MATREENGYSVSEENVATARARLSWRGLAQAAIGIGVLAIVLMKTDVRGLGEALKSTKWAYLPFAVAAAFAMTWLMAYRWSAILKAGGHRVPLRRLFAYYLVGAFFTTSFRAAARAAMSRG